MALFTFTRKILAGEPIEVFNYGKHRRDFTYVDDIVEGVARVLDHVAAPDESWPQGNPSPATSTAPYRIYNIGNNRAEELARYIDVLEEVLGKKAERKLLPLQPGDVPGHLRGCVGAGSGSRLLSAHPDRGRGTAGLWTGIGTITTSDAGVARNLGCGSGLCRAAGCGLLW